jgi:hypothetical protein
MKPLLTIAALAEGLTGLALIMVPSLVTTALLGVPPSDATGFAVCRLTGTALVTIAMACWLSKNDRLCSVVMVKSLIAYNTGAALLLVYSALVDKIAGFGLWPVFLLHMGLAVWCVVIIQRNVVAMRDTDSAHQHTA